VSLLVPPRVDEPELLDEHDAPRADVERSLLDLQRINRWLGGIRTYRKLLARVAPDRRAPLRLVDLGAGTADCLASLDDYQQLTAIAVDFNIVHLARAGKARGARLHRVVADATRLPLRDGSVDVITSAHFFHHFSPQENAAILGDALRAARRAVVVNDTARHRLPLAFVLLLGALRLVGRITRYDAPASVRRAYTPSEARAIGEQTAARRVETTTIVPFRFGLLLWK
jgi:ubiquinone/menaquinone biosynthesis C-methylase UbiE